MTSPLPRQGHIMKPWRKLEEKVVEKEVDETDGENGEAEAEPELTAEEVEKVERLEREEDNPARWAALPVAVIILFSVFGYLVLKSQACMCGTWCNLGAKEAEP